MPRVPIIKNASIILAHYQKSENKSNLHYSFVPPLQLLISKPKRKFYFNKTWKTLCVLLTYNYTKVLILEREREKKKKIELPN